MPRLRGELLLAGTATGEAEAHFRSALTAAASLGALSQQLRAATGLARLLRARGEREAALAVLAPSHERFTEGFATLDLVDAGALLAELRGAA